MADKSNVMRQQHVRGHRHRPRSCPAGWARDGSLGQPASG
jgi:hypothetical protein